MHDKRSGPAVLGPGAAVLAFDVGGSDTKSAVIDESGAVHGLRRTATPRDPADPAGAITAHVGALAETYRREFPHIAPESAGLLVPGLVDDDTGIGVLAANFGWRDVPFRSAAERMLHLPVAFSHDVRGAGEAEFRLGAARAFSDVAVLVIGTGIAGAFIVDGRMLVAGGYAGEIGHSIIVPGGPACPCGGVGRLEAVGSAGAIVRRYGQRTGHAVDGARVVLERAGAGDADAAVVWDEAIDGLALGLAQVVALLGPEAIVVGGGLAQAGDALFRPLEQRLDALLTFHRRPLLLPAQIGEDAGLLGAALRARDLLVPGAASVLPTPDSSTPTPTAADLEPR
ncbi:MULTISPECIES: ROK family protein [unclassified Leifsonia]|uniref:ROK family protein n=1 Tax=unclassified Leifsonia TaxID=2663824 RepID=UPI0009EB550F|nr:MULTISPECIES: ROK family protein [unclassified Leifsonia]